MARHHVRDSEGNLHFFNDEEYKQYRYKNSCLGILALLIFLIGGLVSKCNGDEKSTSNPKTEKVVNDNVKSSTDKVNYTTEVDVLKNEQIETEVKDKIETPISIAETDNHSTIEEDTHEENIETVSNKEQDSVNNDESYHEDMKSLKKRQKEERKRLKQMEKEAKRKAKEEAKEARRRSKEEFM